MSLVERQVLSFDCRGLRIGRADMIFAACLGEKCLTVPFSIACALSLVARGVAGGATDAFFVER